MVHTTLVLFNGGNFFMFVTTHARLWHTAGGIPQTTAASLLEKAYAEKEFKNGIAQP